MTAVAGASAGVLGHAGQQAITYDLYQRHPEWARELLTIGSHPRAGHDRERWKSVNWADYRAKVAVRARRALWKIEFVEETAGSPSTWVAEAEGLPFEPGWYTTLVHAERGIVMSDLPAEIAGCLPFLDKAATLTRARILIAGLGLGIVPAWLLRCTSVERVDVIELDPDVIAISTSLGEDSRTDWADDPRLHIHQGDAHTWWSADRAGCSLHQSCRLRRGARYDGAWLDIYDTVSPENLPSMHRLHRRFGRIASWVMSWERAECEAMRARGQTVDRPDLLEELDGWRVCQVAESGDSR